MTQAAIDAVFADERYRRKFTSPKRDKAICEERMADNLRMGTRMPPNMLATIRKE